MQIDLEFQGEKHGTKLTQFDSKKLIYFTHSLGISTGLPLFLLLVLLIILIQEPQLLPDFIIPLQRQF